MSAPRSLVRRCLSSLRGGRTPSPATTTTTATATAAAVSPPALGASIFRLFVGVVGVVHLGHVLLGYVCVVHDRPRVVLPDDASAAPLHLHSVCAWCGSATQSVTIIYSSRVSLRSLEQGQRKSRRPARNVLLQHARTAVPVAKYLQGCCPGLVDVLGWELPQDRQVFLDVLPALVGLLSEGHGTVAPEVLR